jgi:hypothetical protein
MDQDKGALTQQPLSQSELNHPTPESQLQNSSIPRTPSASGRNSDSTNVQLLASASMASEYTPEEMTKLLTALVVQILPEKGPEQIIELLAGHVHEVIEDTGDSISPDGGTPLTHVVKATVAARANAMLDCFLDAHKKEKKRRISPTKKRKLENKVENPTAFSEDEADSETDGILPSMESLRIEKGIPGY